MRRFALFAVTLTTLAWAGATAVSVVACSSSDAATPKADAGTKKGTSTSSSGDDDDTSKGTSSGDGTSSGGTSSGGTSSGDAGSDAGSTSGALGSDPKKVTCGATPCDVTKDDGTEVCCWTGGDPTKAACGTADQGGCPDGDDFAGFNVFCDEAADCTNQKCCWGNGSASCNGSCADADRPGDDPGQPDIQLCKTNEECGAGVTCAQKTCSFGEDAEQAPDNAPIKIPLKVCGTPKNCK